MAFFNELDDKLKAFIAEQKMFFTASAPREGRVNLSPKGMDTLRVFDNLTVGYLDLTGSGNETAAHLAETGRMTMMFCGFGKQPRILRLYGQGKVIHPRDADWERWCGHFETIPGARQIILLAIESVQTSCGFAVPRYEFIAERQTLREWAEKKGEDGIQAYWRKKNQKSIDGLPTFLLSDDPNEIVSHPEDEEAKTSPEENPQQEAVGGPVK